MNYYLNQNYYDKQLYKANLKKDINKAGIFLIILSTVSYLASLLIIWFTESFNYNSEQPLIYNDTTILLLANGLISVLTFFLAGYIFCKITRIRISKILPFEKNKFSFIFPLCSMALAIAMVANYASAAVMGLFETFGVNASIDTNFKCDGIADIIIYYVTVAIVPACVEEFAFRGVILGALRKHSEGLAIIVSSVTFGLIHGNFSQIPFAFVVGLILGYITIKSNSMLPAIIVHFLNNATSVTISLLLENEHFSTFVVNIIYNSITLIIVVVGIISTVILAKKQKGLFKLSKQQSLLTFKEKVLTFCESIPMIIFAILTFSEAIQMLTPGVNI